MLLPLLLLLPVLLTLCDTFVDVRAGAILCRPLFFREVNALTSPLEGDDVFVASFSIEGSPSGSPGGHVVAKVRPRTAAVHRALFLPVFREIE